jgi:hypothetical protein
MAKNQWTIEDGIIVLNNDEFKFDPTEMPEQNKSFIFWYGIKQFYSSNFAAATDADEREICNDKSAAKLMNPDMVMFYTEKSFGLHDPNAVKKALTPQEKAEKVVKGLVKEMASYIELLVKGGSKEKAAQKIVATLLGEKFKAATEKLERLSK